MGKYILFVCVLYIYLDQNLFSQTHYGFISFCSSCIIYVYPYIIHFVIYLVTMQGDDFINYSPYMFVETLVIIVSQLLFWLT